MARLWLGRISIVKMNVLPRLLFEFQIIPYKIPPGFFKLVQSRICRYVWNRKRPRIAYKWLIKPKNRGGLAIPDFKLYFLAIALNRISDWKYHKNSKLWVQLEMDLSGVDLFLLIWIPSRFRRLAPTVSPLTKSSLAMWDSLRKMQKCPYNSPLMQLTGHDYGTSHWGTWILDSAIGSLIHLSCYTKWPRLRVSYLCRH